MTDPQPTPGAPRQGEEQAGISAGIAGLEADLLLLLRAALADGPLNERGTEALRRIAVGLGVPPAEVPSLLAPLDGFSGGQASLALRELDEERRRRLMLRLMELARADPELSGSAPRLAARLVAILDLGPDAVPDPAA